MIWFLVKVGMAFENLPFTVQTERVHLTVGAIAFCLPLCLLLVAFLPMVPMMTSISHFYYTPIGGDVFVGSLITIGIFLVFIYKIEPTSVG